MAEIEKISVALTSEQVTSLKAAVNSGEYATTSEIIREAVREWQWKRDMRIEEVNRVRALWDAGLESGKALPVDFSAVRVEARAAVRKHSKKLA